MIWVEPNNKDGINNFEVIPLKAGTYEGLNFAYKTLAKSYNGLKDYIDILDGIADGAFSLSEVTVAALILAEGYHGSIYDREKIYPQYHVRYIRINGGDIIALEETQSILSLEDVMDKHLVLSLDCGGYFDVEAKQNKTTGKINLVCKKMKK